jgi:hypothetical protein
MFVKVYSLNIVIADEVVCMQDAGLIVYQICSNCILEIKCWTCMSRVDHVYPAPSKYMRWQFVFMTSECMPSDCT